MKITYKNALDSLPALKGLMSARGLCGTSQIRLVRLWKELSEHVKTLTETDNILVREYGEIGDGGIVSFFDESKKDEFLRRREEMFSEMVEVTPITVKAEDAFFMASSPEALVLLERLIDFEEEEK